MSKLKLSKAQKEKNAILDLIIRIAYGTAHQLGTTEAGEIIKVAEALKTKK